jgi:glycosyltransferase involved in cell wall biosynthesis
MAAQTLSSELFKVLVIDNASTDHTREIVEDYIRQTIPGNLCYLYEPLTGLSNARNSGVEAARSEYIAFIDDDARAEPDWLEVAWRIIKEEGPDIFGGPAYPFFPEGKPDWFKESYGIRGDMGESGYLKEDGFLIGTNIFFRRSLIVEYGGFDPKLGMNGNNIGYHEETLLVKRAVLEGKKVYYARELAVLDLVPEYKRSLAFFIYARYKSGKDRAILENKEVEIDKDEIILLMDEILSSFDLALMKRDRVNYPYPENYIIEVLRKKIVHLGQMVGYLLKKS